MIMECLLMGMKAEDYEKDIIQPAVAMATMVLEAAAQVKSIRRVVLTSSCKRDFLTRRQSQNEC